MGPPGAGFPGATTGSKEREPEHSSALGIAGHSCLMKRKLGLAPWTACFSSGFFSHDLTTT